MQDSEIKHIEHLLDLFMAGKTTIDQEAELSTYFAAHDKVPPEWVDYKAMMAYFDAGMPVADKKTEAPAQQQERQKPAKVTVPPLLRRSARWVAAAAAAAVVLTTTLLRITPYSDISTAEPTTAQANANRTTEPATRTDSPPVIVAIGTSACKSKPTRKGRACPAAWHRTHNTDSTSIDKAEGQLELTYIMAQTDYDEWLSNVCQAQDAERAMMLIQKGAILAMQDYDDVPIEMY